MTTCQTCKHWDNTPVWAAEQNAGYCEQLTQVLIVEGRENAGYAIDTRPDFGCTLHEARHD